MAIALMKKSANSLMDYLSLRKTNKLTRSIKQKHAAVFYKRDTVLTETGVTSFTLPCQLLAVN
jgi:hypothetical protein